MDQDETTKETEYDGALLVEPPGGACRKSATVSATAGASLPADHSGNSAGRGD